MWFILVVVLAILLRILQAMRFPEDDVDGVVVDNIEDVPLNNVEDVLVDNVEVLIDYVDNVHENYVDDDHVYFSRSESTQSDEIVEEESTQPRANEDIVEEELVQHHFGVTTAIVRHDRATLIVCVLLLTIGGLMIGHLNNVSGGVLSLNEYLVKISHKILRQQRKAFIEDIFCVYINHWILVHASIIPFATLVGTCATLFLKHWKRKSILVVGNLLVITGVICMSWFPSLPVDILGLMMAGFGAGLLQQVILKISTEILPKYARRLCLIILQISIVVGSTLASGSNLVASHFHLWGWRVSLAVPGLLGIPLLGLSMIIMESPCYFLEKGNIEKARDILKMSRGVSNIEDELNHMSLMVESRRAKNIFVQIFKNENRLVFFITMVGSLLTSFLGVEVFVLYGPYILESLNYNSHQAYFATFVLSLAYLISQGVGFYIIRRFGRKTIYTIACVAAFTSQVVLVIILHELPYKTNHLAHQQATTAGIMVVINVIVHGFLPGPLDWLHSSYTEDCDELGFAITTSWNLFLTVLTNQVMLHILCTFKEWTILFYVARSVLLLGFIHAFLPKTHGTEQSN